MRSRRQRRPLSLLLAMALCATAAELYAMQVQFGRELARIEGNAGTQAVATAQALTQQLTLALATPTPAPAHAQTPRDAIGMALNAALEVMRDPTDGRLPALQRVADPTFVNAYRQEIDHLKKNGLRLSPRSGYQIVRLEQVQSDLERASFLSEEEWLYEEQHEAGEVVRCLVEVSSQRYQVEQRAGRWIVADVSLSGNPLRKACGERGPDRPVAGGL